MSEYSAVRKGHLKLKGKAGSQFKKKFKRKRDDTSHHQTLEPGEMKHGSKVVKLVISCFIQLRFVFFR